MFQFGMPTLLENKSLTENAILCRRLGLAFIELNMNFLEYQEEYLRNTKLLRAVAEEYSLYYTIHLPEELNVCDFNSRVRTAYLDTMKAVLEIAQDLHVPLLNLHMNHGIYITLPDRKTYLFQEKKERYLEDIDNFRKLCIQETGSYGPLISIENTDGYREFEKEAIRILLGDKRFSLTWDIGHSHGAGNTDEPFLMEHEDRLGHFHIHDALGKSNHLPLGSGEIDLSQRIALARKHGCRCVLETKTIAALEASVEWIKRNL